MSIMRHANRPTDRQQATGTLYVYQNIALVCLPEAYCKIFHINIKFKFIFILHLILKLFVVRQSLAVYTVDYSMGYYRLNTAEWKSEVKEIFKLDYDCQDEITFIKLAVLTLLQHLNAFEVHNDICNNNQV